MEDEKKRAAMIPLPIREPFKRIAMGIVGPLPHLRKTNCFVFVISDYTTRYSEAVPLTNITALADIFSRHGIPEEILTDQGTNFTSSLLGELYQLTCYNPKNQSYHPQADGLVERFSQTPKDMLRKTLEREKEHWDQMLPFVLV